MKAMSSLRSYERKGGKKALDGSGPSHRRVSRFAPINANCAPLTARPARRLSSPGRAFAFNPPLSAVPKKQKKPRKGVFPMQQLSKQPAFELGQIVATPGALAALKKAGQQPGEFLPRHVNREWGDLSDEERKETTTGSKNPGPQTKSC